MAFSAFLASRTSEAHNNLGRVFEYPAGSRLPSSFAGVPSARNIVSLCGWWGGVDEICALNGSSHFSTPLSFPLSLSQVSARDQSPEFSTPYAHSYTLESVSTLSHCSTVTAAACYGQTGLKCECDHHLLFSSLFISLEVKPLSQGYVGQWSMGEAGEPGSPIFESWHPPPPIA